MKAFHFRLQAILTLREQAEQAAQQRCARAYAELETATAAVRSAEAAIDALEHARREQMNLGRRAGEIERMQAYAVLLQERRLMLERKLAEARRQAELARRHLLFASQQREALERLRNRQRRTYEYQSARAEQKLLDELVSHRATLDDAWRQSTSDV